MQKKITVRYYLTSVEWLLSKRQNIASVRKDVQKLEASYAAGGNRTQDKTLED